MGGKDHCAVYGCNNNRKYPESVTRMPHVGILRWHSPKSVADATSWNRALNRGGGFKVTMQTRVCSNHFLAGYRSDTCRIPTLYLRGYDTPQAQRASPRKRLQPPRKKRVTIRSGFDIPTGDDLILTPLPGDHEYVTNDLSSSTSRCCPVNFECSKCSKYRNYILSLKKRLLDQEQELKKLRKEVTFLKRKKSRTSFSIDNLKNNAKLVSLYTGLQNYKVFEWLYNLVKDKASRMSYYRSGSLSTPSKVKKSVGRKRKMSSKDEFFLTLCRLRQGLTEQDLAYRFSISVTTCSEILSTWLPFLGRELQGLIYWPSREDVKQVYPPCFRSYPNVIGIIDCTEGSIERPSLAKAQAQTYSTYKSKNTWKKLVSITPLGTISFISKSYGGSASDRYITENSGFLDHLKDGDYVMADKGFKINDLLLPKGAQLVIPPFLKSSRQFTAKNCIKTANIAKARIHVERAIARIKDFRILQNSIPLTYKDLLDDIFTICCAITNLAPPLVQIPLQ